MSSARRASRQKRQTQLTFTPLPSSSPSLSQLTPAAVRYGTSLGSPTKKRRTEDIPAKSLPLTSAKSRLRSAFDEQELRVIVPSPRRKSESEQLPTPEVSSQVNGEGEEMLGLVEITAINSPA